ncbi:MAG TPA: DUF2569 family protein [Sphingomicrobium sp.]|nr:DUF2569 family protein [Sphingomicrobium sp.]
MWQTDELALAKRMSTRAEPVGIGGWLALLVVWMVVLRPVAGVYMLNQLQAGSLADPIIIENSSWLINTSTFWIIFLFVAALSIYGGLRLWRDRSPAAVTTAIVIQWIYSPVAAVDLLIAREFLEGQVTWPNAVTTVGINLAIAAVWTAYLKRSRRVRKTYFEQPACQGT